MLNQIRRMLRRPEIHRVHEIRFVGEQDGVSERELKAKLVALLERRPQVDRAYLAQVVYADAPSGVVALCLAGPQDPDLISDIGREFRKQFASGVHLDILFVSDEQELKLMQVCTPFFDRARTNL